MFFCVTHNNWRLHFIHDISSGYAGSCSRVVGRCQKVDFTFNTTTSVQRVVLFFCMNFLLLLILFSLNPWECQACSSGLPVHIVSLSPAIHKGLDMYNSYRCTSNNLYRGADSLVAERHQWGDYWCLGLPHKSQSGEHILNLIRIVRKILSLRGLAYPSNTLRIEVFRTMHISPHRWAIFFRVCKLFQISAVSVHRWVYCIKGRGLVHLCLCIEYCHWNVTLKEWPWIGHGTWFYLRT